MSDKQNMQEIEPIGDVVNGRVMWLRSQYNQGVKTKDTRAANALYARDYKARRAALSSQPRKAS